MRNNLKPFDSGRSINRLFWDVPPSDRVCGAETFSSLLLDRSSVHIYFYTSMNVKKIASTEMLCQRDMNELKRGTFPKVFCSRTLVGATTYRLIHFGCSMLCVPPAFSAQVLSTQSKQGSQSMAIQILPITRQHVMEVRHHQPLEADTDSTVSVMPTTETSLYEVSSLKLHAWERMRKIISFPFRKR